MIRILHTCGCSPKRPCDIAYKLFAIRADRALEMHLEQTMRVDKRVEDRCAPTLRVPLGIAARSK